MGSLLALYQRLQHLLLIVLCVVLLAGSGQLTLLRSLPAHAGFWNLTHVWLGLLASVVAFTFFISNLTGGSWRQYYGIVAGNWHPVWHDLCGLGKGRIPAAGGVGLFSLIEGLTMIALLAVCFSGCMWFFEQGSKDALFWRGWHHSLIYVFVTLLILHVLCALSHLLDLIRD
ncbi:cytochrome b/b6 domain-containing protein [Shewanella yunxiaonensis]|uniref:Cytochrome b/b6 domain-containing protein n=1 Tax=Shewanella yunxiaonensis TaxID=2829809 RepID=A0ABX7YUS7_9GAMM|nr:MULTISPECIES: cytochrome b/b6 domain-containing protein [Shewanella]MDF0533163.1 cytochrome b/b6 domain-containing protein [Shewanella sp. A32]QUN06508.1 cytochrome b/b6 domain-containing protein [Shewanella yunxiaonensis]